MHTKIHVLRVNLEKKWMPAYAKFPHIYMCNVYPKSTHRHYSTNPMTHTLKQTHIQGHTHFSSCVILPMPSWTGTNNRGGVNCEILKLSLSVTLCQLCISLYQTHTFAPSSLKQHREQGLWIINTRKVPHNSVHRCPSSKQCWCVEQESHGRSLGEYKIHVQTQTRTELADF